MSFASWKLTAITVAVSLSQLFFLVTYMSNFFQKLILIEMKRSFTPWENYWEVILSFTQFSAVSFATFKNTEP